MRLRQSPGACPVCGKAHAACTTGTGPVTAVMVPARDAAAVTGEVVQTSAQAEVAPVPLVAEVVQSTLPKGEFTSGTYRGTKAKR